MKQLLTILLLTTLPALSAKAQTYWNFGTTAPEPAVTTNGTTGVSGSVASSNQNFAPPPNLITNDAPSNGYVGASGDYNLGASAVSGALLQTASAYFEVTLTPATGSSVSISAINFGTWSNNTGPVSYAIFTSLDNYTVAEATGTISNTSIWQLSANPLNLMGAVDVPVTVRIYGFGSLTAGPTIGEINWRIDDLTVNGDLVLPVKLLSFSATPTTDRQVQLSWSVAGDETGSSYSVEKSSDSKSFREIGFLSAVAGRGSFQFADAAGAGTAYYRLKITEGNGAVSFSNTLRVAPAVPAGGSLQLYPNPTTGPVTAMLPSTEVTAQIQLTDAGGRLLRSARIPAGTASYTLSTEDLTSGIYLLSYEDEKGQRQRISLVRR